MAVPNCLSKATEPGGAGSACGACGEVFTDPLTSKTHEQLCGRCVQCHVKLEPLEQWQRGDKKPLCKPCFDKTASDPWLKYDQEAWHMGHGLRMTIQYPVRVCRDLGNPEVHIRDASNRIIAAHLIGIIAQEIVDALNAQGKSETTAPDRLWVRVTPNGGTISYVGDPRETDDKGGPVYIYRLCARGG